MSREIKFRQWYDGKMRYLGHVNTGVGQLGFSDEYWIDLSDEHEQCDIMQFTGLLDKNGTEIYDSDIVRLKFREAPDEYSFELGVIKWHEPSSAFKWFALDEDPSDGNNYWLTYADCDGREVVGNLYEHPHLLEESS